MSLFLQKWALKKLSEPKKFHMAKSINNLPYCVLKKILKTFAELTFRIQKPERIKADCPNPKIEI